MNLRPAIIRGLRLATLAPLGVSGLLFLGLAVLGCWRGSFEFIAELERFEWTEIGMHSVPLLALLVLNAVGAWYISGFCREGRFRIAGGILAAILAGDLLAIDCLPFVLDAVSGIATLRGAPLVYGAGLGLVALPWLTMSALNALLPSWRMILTGYAIMGGAFLCLAWDDALLAAPRTFAQLSPEFPGAKESYEVWMRYGRKHPAGRDFKSTDRIYHTGGFALMSQPVAWTKWIRRARRGIEADWAELRPVHEWIQELDKFERIGDLTPVGPDAEMIAWGALRSYNQHCGAIAGLLALDNKGDDAIALILPSLRVSRKLDVCSRSIVRTALAGAMQRQTMDTIEYILQSTAVSAAMQRQLSAALADNVGAQEQIDRLFDMEIASISEFQGRIDRSCYLPPGPTRLIIEFLGPVALNQHRTDNLYVGSLLAMKRIALSGRTADEMKRDMDTYLAKTSGPRIKNYGGILIYHKDKPNYLFFAQAYLNMEIRRAALRERLAR